LGRNPQRGRLDVARKLQDAAEVTYRRAKRSLELEHSHRSRFINPNLKWHPGAS
jgi:hypothetical protein